MDAGFLRGLYTLFMFIAFLGIAWWAWSARRKSDFNEAANLPLESDQLVTSNEAGAGKVREGAEQ